MGLREGGIIYLTKRDNQADDPHCFEVLYKVNSIVPMPKVIKPISIERLNPFVVGNLRWNKGGKIKLRGPITERGSAKR